MMDRLTYMLFIGLCYYFFFLLLINPTNCTQSGLGLGHQQLSDFSASFKRGSRDINELDYAQRRSADVQPSATTAKSALGTSEKSPTMKPSPTLNVNDTSKTGSNNENTTLGSYGKFIDGIASTTSLKRMLYILLSVTAIAVVYFVFRTIRLRRNRKTRKYGVLTTNSDHLEMAPLDQEEEDEDMTVFEANSRYK